MPAKLMNEATTEITNGANQAMPFAITVPANEV